MSTELPKTDNSELSRLELGWLAGHLRFMAEIFEEHTCTDFYHPQFRSEEHYLPVFAAIWEHSDQQDSLDLDDDTWPAPNQHYVMAYFADRCAELLKEHSAIAISAAEYEILAAILQDIHDYHADSADDEEEYGPDDFLSAEDYAAYQQSSPIDLHEMLNPLIVRCLELAAREAQK